MFARLFRYVAAAIVLLAVAAIGSFPAAAYGQHGGGHHGGGGHGGFGHGGFSHGGVGHGGYGHGGYGHGYYGHGGYGHSLYGHYGLGHYGLGYHHYTPHYSYYYWPGYGYYGYGRLGYGSYGLYGSGVYAQPYTTAYSPTSDYAATIVSSGEPRQDYQSSAENAFRAGDYTEAARLANHAVVETPRNGRLFLFVSQALFAVGDYQGATAALNQAATLLEPNDWGYVVQNFRDYYRNDDYVRQMERLTKFIEENPQAAYARTLRGYHYGFLGYKEAAQRDLTKALELEKRDKLASQLLEQFGVTAPTTPSATPPANPPKDTTEPRDEGHKDHVHEKGSV